MKTRNKPASILLGCCLLTGCSSLHKDVQSGAPLEQCSFVAQQTTHHQVLEELGPPARLTASPNGFAFLYEDLLVDEHQLGISGRGKYLQWFKLAMARTTLKNRALLLQFSHHGDLTSAGLVESEEFLGKGGAIQTIIEVSQIVDSSDFEDDALDAARWGASMLEPLPHTLNAIQNLTTGTSGLEQSGTTTKVGQHTLEMR